MASPMGGQCTLGASATQLSAAAGDNELPYRQITVRSNTGNAVAYFGNSDVTAGPTNAHGFVKAEESYTFGPFQAGGVYPKDIYLIGTQNNVFFWSGVPL